MDKNGLTVSPVRMAVEEMFDYFSMQLLRVEIITLKGDFFILVVLVQK